MARCNCRKKVARGGEEYDDDESELNGDDVNGGVKPESDDLDGDDNGEGPKSSSSLVISSSEAVGIVPNKACCAGVR